MKHAKKILSLLLTLVLLVGLLPGMSLTAYAAETSESFRTNQQMATYTGEHFTISCQYAGDEDGFLLKTNNSATISARNGETITKVEFTKGCYDIINLRSATGDVTYSGNVATVSNVNATSLTVNASDFLQIKAVTVYYRSGYNVTITGGANATTSGGETSQIGLTGAMTTVTYTANSGNIFPETSELYKTTNGITVARTSDTVVTVSGTPTANVSITVPDAAAIPTYTVTYIADNGTDEKAVENNREAGDYIIQAYDQRFTAPEGKVFDYWQGSDGGKYRDGQTIQLTGNLTLTAQWKDEKKPDGDSGSGKKIEITGDIVFIGGGFGGDDTGWDYVGGGYAPQQAYRVSLAPMQGGSASLGLTTGESTETAMNVYPSSTVYVFPNAEQGYVLDKIVWSLIDGSASYDITEAKNFVMPAMDAVVYVTFRPVG